MSQDVGIADQQNT